MNFGPSFGAMSSSSIPITMPSHSGIVATIIARYRIGMDFS